MYNNINGGEKKLYYWYVWRVELISLLSMLNDRVNQCCIIG